MFMKEPKNLHDAIKPLLYFNYFLGMGAFRHPNQSESVYFRIRVYTVFVTLINWTMVYVGLNSISEAIDFDNQLPMAITMYKALVFTNSFIALFAPFLIWLQGKRMGAYFQQIPVLDETFQTLFGNLKGYRRMYIRLISQNIAIVCVMFLVGVCDVVWNLEMNIQMNFRSIWTFQSVGSTLHKPILVMLLLDVNFCTLVGYLEEKFRDLNNGLLGMVEKSSTPSSADRLFIVTRDFTRIRPSNKVNNTKAERLTIDKHYLLQEIRKVYLELCKLSRLLNITFGIQNLLSMGLSFTMVTGLLYYIYSSLSAGIFKNERLIQVIPSVVWTTIYMFKIWMVNHYCWSISSEAARTGEVIYELLKSKVDKAFQKEIQEFAVQILQNPVRFDACGFFTLNYAFVQGVIGSITTYLIILIQISNMPVPDTSGLIGNDTTM